MKATATELAAAHSNVRAAFCNAALYETAYSTAAKAAGVEYAAPSATGRGTPADVARGEADLERAFWGLVVEAHAASFPAARLATLRAEVANKSYNYNRDAGRNAFPAFTAANVEAWVAENVGACSDELLTERVREVFSRLASIYIDAPRIERAGFSNPRGTSIVYFALGKKATYQYFSTKYTSGSYTLARNTDTDLLALHNAFCAVDSVEAYVPPSLTYGSLYDATRDWHVVSTPYFDVEPRKNCGATITFKRPDLVEALNGIMERSGHPYVATKKEAHEVGK